MNKIDCALDDYQTIKELEYFISKFEIVSFDVFDTLLFRKTAHPEGVFDYIEIKTGNAGFAKRRIAAEKAAREINFSKYESHETTLMDIYKLLHEDDRQRKESIDQEIEAEYHFLISYSKNKKIYNMARSLNKKIIAISDMYMPASEIDKILKKNDIHVDEIFCSSSYYKDYLSKSNGKIYPFICRSLNVSPKEIIHFGDNYHSDFVQSISAGIPAIHTSTALRELLYDRNLNSDLISALNGKHNLEGNIILGLIAKRHSEGYFNNNSTLKSFGYIYSGIVITSFIKNIVDISKKYKVKKLFLMTRDGFIIQRVMDKLDLSDIDYDVIWSSRRMCLVPLLGMGKQYDWVYSMLFPPKGNNSYSLKEDLIRLHIDAPADFPDINEISYEIYIEKLKKIGNLWNSVVYSERDSYINYLNDLIGEMNLSDIAFVDVGWGLSSHRALDIFLEYQIKGFYIGTHKKAYATKNIHGILFQEGKPEEIAHTIMNGVELIELMFSDASPSSISMKKAGEKYYPVFEKRNAADVSRDIYVKEIQNCIMDFVSDIAPYFSLFSADILKNMAEDCMSNILSRPTSSEKEILGSIPHACDIGHGRFLPISYWWHPHWSQAERDSFALHGRILPKSELIGRKILDPIIGKKGADWVIKSWNKNKRRFK